MVKASLESRLEKLERQVTQLLANSNSRLESLQPPTDAWRSAIGAFKGAGMKEVLDEALKIRERHRADFRKQQSRRRPSAKRRKVTP
jgi:hypothetical protein